MKSFTFPLLAVSLILQGSLVSFPLVFVGITLLAIKKNENWIIPFAFLSGLMLDSFYFKTLGTTSLFFMIFMFSLFLYHRKFETENETFIFAASFLGSMVLFLILNESNLVLKALITSVFTIITSKSWDYLT